VSNADAKFLSHFWTFPWKLVETKLLFSTTCHPQSDEQMEVTNKTPVALLKCMVSMSLRDQDVKLAHAEFTSNGLLLMLPRTLSLMCSMVLTLLLPLIFYLFFKNQG